MKRWLMSLVLGVVALMLGGVAHAFGVFPSNEVNMTLIEKEMGAPPGMVTGSQDPTFLSGTKHLNTMNSVTNAGGCVDGWVNATLPLQAQTLASGAGVPWWRCMIAFIKG